MDLFWKFLIIMGLLTNVAQSCSIRYHHDEIGALEAPTDPEET